MFGCKSHLLTFVVHPHQPPIWTSWCSSQTRVALAASAHFCKVRSRHTRSILWFWVLLLTTCIANCISPAAAWCEYTENRKDTAMLLEALAQPVLLEPEPNTVVAAAGKDTGICMEERMSLRGQRELWSALVRLSSGEG